MHVGAKDLGTGKQQTVRIVASSTLSEEEIKRMMNDADRHRQADRKKKELAELRLNAEGLVYTTERSIEEYRRSCLRTRYKEILVDLEALKNLVAATTRIARQATGRR